jgi:hypothetical protein
MPMYIRHRKFAVQRLLGEIPARYSSPAFASATFEIETLTSNNVSAIAKISQPTTTAPLFRKKSRTQQSSSLQLLPASAAVAEKRPKTLGARCVFKSYENKL